MAAKNEDLGSSSSGDQKDSRQLLVEILSRINLYAERYQRGYEALLEKISEDENAEWGRINAVEKDKNQLENHLDQFTQHIETAGIHETMEEEKEGAENKSGKRKRIPPVMVIMDLIVRLEKQANAVNEKKAMQVNEVLNTIKKLIGIYYNHEKKYQESTMGRLEKHEQEMETVHKKLGGILIIWKESAKPK